MTNRPFDALAPGQPLRTGVAILCVLLILPARPTLFAEQAQAAAGPPQEPAAKLPPAQLDSLVAPVALYPDPMLSQTLIASTYPLEIVQLQQWLEKNKGLKDQALADAVKKQSWDPSIQSMAALPDVVKQLADNIKWTSDLGNAFLAQQEDVMEAVQRMRKKALDAGNLKTTTQQQVETKVVETKTVVVIQQANPQVVYVPAYNPVVVYGAPVYPYPAIVYPPPPPPGAVAAGMAISFGVGVAMGAMWHGGWGYGCGWGHNDINVNINNNFNRSANINRNTNIANAGNKWQHNPQHRGGAPYADRATANRYGGPGQRGSQLSNRPQAGTMDRRANNKAGAGVADRGGVSDSANSMRGDRGGGDRIGNREVSRPSAGDRNAFSGAATGRGGGSARASSDRGSFSAGSRGGGGRGRK